MVALPARAPLRVSFLIPVVNIGHQPVIGDRGSSGVVRISMMSTFRRPASSGQSWELLRGLCRGYDVDFYIDYQPVFVSHGTKRVLFGMSGAGQDSTMVMVSSVCLWGIRVLFCGVSAVRFIVCGRLGTAG